MIEDVYHAEKTKQEVMRKMIVAADEDRDAALGELDRMRLKTLSRFGHQKFRGVSIGMKITSLICFACSVLSCA